MYTILVVSSVLFFQSSRNTLDKAPKTGSAMKTEANQILLLKPVSQVAGYTKLYEITYWYKDHLQRGTRYKLQKATQQQDILKRVSWRELQKFWNKN